jgi:hypothetical protein
MKLYRPPTKINKNRPKLTFINPFPYIYIDAYYLNFYKALETIMYIYMANKNLMHYKTIKKKSLIAPLY